MSIIMMSIISIFASAICLCILHISHYFDDI